MKSFKLKLQLVALILITAMSLNAYAAIVGDSDGGAFVTKSEFDALKKNFAEQIEQYNSSIENKIDGAIASYLAGINLNSKDKLDLLTSAIYNISWHAYENYLIQRFGSISSGRVVTYSYFWPGTSFWGRTNYNYIQNAQYVFDSGYDAATSWDDYLYPKLLAQDDENEMWTLIPTYKSTFQGRYVSSGTSASLVQRWSELKGVVSTVGNISRCLLSMQASIRTASCTINAYDSRNIPAPQNKWSIADTYCAYYLSMANPYRRTDLSNNWFTIEIWWTSSNGPNFSYVDSLCWTFNNYVGLTPYFYYKMSGWGTGSSAVLRGVTDVRNVMYASIRNSTYVGTVSANLTTSIGTSFKGYYWGSSNAHTEGRLWSFYGIHTSGYAAKRNSTQDKTPRYTTNYNWWGYTPWYNQSGALCTYKNYEMAVAGYDLGMCDGVPLFRATKDGIVTLSMSATYYQHSLNSASGTYSYLSKSHSRVPYLNLKIGNFSGISSANGSTLKLYDYSNKRESSAYAQNLQPFSTNMSTGAIHYRYYIKVKRGDVIYCRLDPRTQGYGIDYAKIVNCTATIENE